MTTNTLNSHTGESRNSRADKMSGLDRGFKKSMIGKSKRIIKKFYSSKRRMFLKNTKNFKKI